MTSNDFWEFSDYWEFQARVSGASQEFRKQLYLKRKPGTLHQIALSGLRLVGQDARLTSHEAEHTMSRLWSGLAAS